MAASVSELDMRVRTLETRVGRHDEDMEAVVDTISKTFTVVMAVARKLEIDVEVLLDEDEQDED